MSHTKKFFSYYRPYLGTFIAVMICAFIAAGASLLLPLCTRYITKDLLAQGTAGAMATIYRVGGMMLVLVAIQVATNSFVDYRGHAMGAMMENDMRSELFNHLQRLSFRFYDGEKTGALMSRITNDLLSLSELYHHGPEDLMIYLVRFIGAFVILLGINPKLTGVVFAFLPVMVLYTYVFNKRLRKCFRVNRQRIGDINAQVEDTLSGIRVVKSFANEPVEQEKFAHESRRFLHSRKSIYGNEAWFYQGMTAFTQLITVALVVFGGINIIRAQLDLADLITFLLYVGYITEPIQKLAQITGQYQEGLAGFDRFMEIMEQQPDIADAPDAQPVTQVRGDVSFQEVSFRYGPELDDVLRKVNLHVRPGEYVALVGPSGVGKTTLCALIPRFYDVTEGTVALDGQDIRKLRLRDLRRAIGVVQQDVYLFAGTVLENIRYGRPEASYEDIVAAAKAANAHEFIMELPQGYDTDIGERGVKLSGGQKQRLSIARVFLKDPAILIFDEATSALDNESEIVIRQSLEELAKGRTTFVIAHRLSTIRNAGRILVLENGGIVEEGTHDALLQHGGAYAKLYQLGY